MPYLPGPMFWKSDLTVLKGVKFTERQGLEVRVAAFNFLNHDLLSFTPNDSHLQAVMDATGKITQPDFGKATAHYGKRIMELGIKYFF